MTDITELAQRMKTAAEKLDADQWQTRKGFSGIEVIVKGSLEKGHGCVSFQPVAADMADTKTARAIALFSPANVLALVEALEKSEKTSEARREAIDRTHNMFVRERDRANAAEEALEKAQTINAAAEKLVRCKGRYHSEQNYRALAALFGVTTPDLPPLEHENVHYADAAEMEIAALRQRIAELESRTVKLPDGWQFEECEIEGCENGAIFSVGTGSRNIHLCDKCAHEPQNSRLKKSPLSKRLPFKMSAGIKVEVE
ncbi:ead/Ea22-like family protein [Escherichia coli]|uniref:ead/Ea22-like family protein n=1 Tax=Escherichia coli TaxID=562 RepID=UPI003008E7F2